MTDAEAQTIARRMCPSPFAEVIGRLFLQGHTAHQIATRFAIPVQDVAALVRWVCETNLRNTATQP